MNNLIIRQCNTKDLENVLTLQHLWVNEEITYGFVASNREYLKSKLGEYFLVAEINREIVGFVYGTIHKAKDITIFQEGEFYIEIDDIYISANSRGNEIGSQLLDELLRIAKSKEIKRSLIYSSTKNMEKIMRFYHKHGYKTWNVQMFK